jgi:hypothetical protein
MLVIRGSTRFLPALTGIFDPSRLFIVSRELPSNETVWMVSDDISPKCKTVFEQLEQDERVWFPKVWQDLRGLSPHTFARPERFRWGIYTAPKAEVQFGEHRRPRGHVDTLRISNVCAVWPTKLTLAPAISRQVLGAVCAELKTSAGSSPEWNTRQDVTIARERWTTTGLLPWDDFSHRYPQWR